MRSLIPAIINNFKCLSANICDDLNKKDTIVFVDLIDDCETFRKELFEYMKIAKKFKEELKLANLKKDDLIVRLDESNKKSEFFRNEVSYQDEKMKSLEQKLAESKAKLENLSNSKLAVNDRSISVSLKPKADNVYIPPFKRNHKEKAYVARLEKGKNSDVDIEISKPTVRVQKKYVFVPVTFVVCLLL